MLSNATFSPNSPAGEVFRLFLLPHGAFSYDSHEQLKHYTKREWTDEHCRAVWKLLFHKTDEELMRFIGATPEETDALEQEFTDDSINKANEYIKKNVPIIYVQT